MNRKRVILAALLGVLAFCLLYAYLATPRLEKAPPRKASQRVQRSVTVAGALESKGAQERINFDFLLAEPQKFSGAKRDIFRFEGRRPIARAPKVALPAPVIPPVVAPVPLQPVPVDVIKKALSQFTFLGFLEKAGEKSVFLSSNDSLFVVKRGESFGVDQEFLVADIDDNLLQVRHVGRDDLVEIQLIEQQKLSAAVSSPAHIQPIPRASSQPRTRMFTPKRRVLRPAVPQERAEPFPEIFEENDPAEERESESPAEWDVLEGDVNGTNQ